MSSSSNIYGRIFLAAFAPRYFPKYEVEIDLFANDNINKVEYQLWKGHGTRGNFKSYQSNNDLRNFQDYIFEWNSTNFKLIYQDNSSQTLIDESILDIDYQIEFLVLYLGFGLLDNNVHDIKYHNDYNLHDIKYHNDSDCRRMIVDHVRYYNTRKPKAEVVPSSSTKLTWQQICRNTGIWYLFWNDEFELDFKTDWKVLNEKQHYNFMSK